MEDNDEIYVESFSKLWHRFLRPLNLESSEEFKELKKLSHTEVTIIDLIYNNPDIILREICEEIDVPKSSMTSIIDRLEKKNILRRIISKRDRRSFGLELTELGEEIQRQHGEYEKYTFTKIINSLDTDDEKETFLKLAGKIADKLDDKKNS